MCKLFPRWKEGRGKDGGHPRCVYNIFFKKESVAAGRGSELEMSKYWYLFNHHG